MKQIALSVLLTTLWTNPLLAVDKNSTPELIIRFKSPIELHEVNKILESFDLVLIKKISNRDTYLCKLSHENIVPIDQMIKLLNEQPKIKYAEMNTEVKAINKTEVLGV